MFFTLTRPMLLLAPSINQISPHPSSSGGGWMGHRKLGYGWDMVGSQSWSIALGMWTAKQDHGVRGTRCTDQGQLGRSEESLDRKGAHAKAQKRKSAKARLGILAFVSCCGCNSSPWSSERRVPLPLSGWLGHSHLSPLRGGGCALIGGPMRWRWGCSQSIQCDLGGECPGLQFP